MEIVQHLAASCGDLQVQPQPEGKVPFDIVEDGGFGNITIQDTVTGPFLRPLSSLPAGLPPSMKSETADIASFLNQEYLLNLRDVDIHDVNTAQRNCAVRTQDATKLYDIVSSSTMESIGVVKDPVTGEAVGFKQIEVLCADEGANNSTSLLRQPGRSDDFTFGVSTNYPFRPGGLEVAESSSTVSDDVHRDKDWLLFDEDKLLCQPPGFSEPIDLSSNTLVQESVVKGVNDSSAARPPPVLSIASLVAVSDAEDEQSQDDEISDSSEEAKELAEGDMAAMDLVLESSATAVEAEPAEKAKKRWAIRVDVSAKIDNFEWYVPQMAFEWPFELDTFQKQAVIRLEQNESVFIAAHTSAGKTVVAEYAIALCAQHMTRCIYTSPIKALSNQKFRDFRNTFEDVGLLTGDVQIRPEASCLIMTTEILRSMLYRGADLIRDVEWVIFDEVHYVNDAERGVVWEEVIIMLPKHVNLIFLSATVPNTMEFADWVGRTKQKNIHVIGTTSRPVPLEHFLYTGNSSQTSNELFKIVDSKKNLLDAGYRQAKAALKARDSSSSSSGKGSQRGGRGRGNSRGRGNRGGSRGGNRRGGGGGGGGWRHHGSDKGLYVSLVNMLKKKEMLPTVVFTFSKKRCESNADSLSALDLTTSKEKSAIHVFIDQSINRLKGSDRKLPQVLRMRELLKLGIGVHHGGLLPIIKEMVEMLFGRGLVKILFATETFAMGVNMPARCVVFDSIKKHDGTGMRELLSGEYIQMAGRAGRRGLDDTGTVIILCKGEVQEISILKQMMLGIPTRLESKFRLTYNMILNLLRVEELQVEDMLKRSFAEFAGQRDASDNKSELAEGERVLKAKNFSCDICTDLKEFTELTKHLLHLHHKIQEAVLNSPGGVKCLSTGRIVVVNNIRYRNALAVVLRTEESLGVKKLKVLVIRDDPMPDLGKESPLPLTKLFVPKGALGYDVVNIDGLDVLEITSKKIKHLDLIDLVDRPKASAQSELAQELMRMAQKDPDGLPQVHLVKELKLNNLEFVEAYRQRESLQKQLRENYQCIKCPHLDIHYANMIERVKLADKISELQFQLSNESLQLMPEFEKRVNVLHHLRYIDEDRAVQLKGRVACEISTCDEVIVTELLFQNALTHLAPEEIVALLSALVFQQRKVDMEPTLTPALQSGVEIMKNTAAQIAEVQLQCGMDTPVDMYVAELHFGLVEVVYEWARGTPFAEITMLTNVLEGSIVRCIVRLDETCRDVRNAARVIGDPLLYQKMDEASTMIKRDIVFAASLYTS